MLLYYYYYIFFIVSVQTRSKAQKGKLMLRIPQFASYRWEILNSANPGLESVITWSESGSLESKKMLLDYLW